MIGSFLTRGLVMILGYAYPAYECYKTVEKNKPEIEQLRFWCQYWILVAVMTVSERVGDTFVSWVPMYSEAKLLFIIYLWFPKTKGTTYVYDSFFRPYLAKHENDIDRNLLELRTRAGDIAILYWQRAASYSQTRIFDVLQYVAAQSTPRPRPAQPQPGVRGRQPPAARQPAPALNRQPATTTPSQPEEPPSPTSSTSSSKDQREIAEALAASLKSKAAPQAIVSNTQKAPAAPESSSQSKPTEAAEAMQTEAVTSFAATEKTIPPPKDSLIEGTIRQTRALLRKTRSAAALAASPKSKAAPQAIVSNTQKAPAAPESSSQSKPTEAVEAMQTEAVTSSAATEKTIPPPKDSLTEGAIRQTQASLRKTRSAAAAAAAAAAIR